MTRAAYLLSLFCVFPFAPACGPEPVDPCDTCGSASQDMLPCDPESGCPDPGGEPSPRVESWVSVTIRNDSPMYRDFNAGWAVNPDESTHPTGWLIPSESLAPGEVRFLPNAFMALEGDTVLIGVSGYSLKDPSAWARAEPQFTAPAGPVSCTFSYQYEGSFPLVTFVCPAVR